MIRPNNFSVVQQSANNVEITLELNPELFWFKGHFSVQPILPGVAQLDWVMDFACEYFNKPFKLQGIKNIKFQQPLQPNQSVTLSVSFIEEKSVLEFYYKQLRNQEIKPISSGRLSVCL